MIGDVGSFGLFSHGRGRWCVAFLFVCAVFGGFIDWGLFFHLPQEKPISASSAAMAVSMVMLPSIPSPPSRPLAQKPAPAPKPVLPPLVPAPPVPSLPLPPVAPPSHPKPQKTEQTKAKQNDLARRNKTPSTSPESPPAMAFVKGQAVASDSKSQSLKVPDWESQILEILQRRKHYPAQAQLDGEQGIASVRFTMDRQGHVLSATLVRSSGFASLDAEAIALIHRASPLPMPPSTLAGDIIVLSVPIVFFLNQNFLLRKSD